MRFDRNVMADFREDSQEVSHFIMPDDGKTTSGAIESMFHIEVGTTGTYGGQVGGDQL